MSIDLAIHGAIATVTLNNLAALNALDEEHLRDLERVFAALSARSDIRAIILTGAGERSFSAGADVRRMQDMGVDDAHAYAELGHAATRAIESVPQPVVAAVNGFALGGGCELALACDIRIASSVATFAQPEVTLGILPGWGGTQRLPRVVGKGIASELIFTGRQVPAEEALRIGLVNRVVAPEELSAAAATLAEQIAANSPAAVRASKHLIAQAFSPDMAVSLLAEARSFAAAFAWLDQREGMAAFSEKRAASFVDVPDEPQEESAPRG